MKRSADGRVLLTRTEARRIALMLASFQGFLDDAIRNELIDGEVPEHRAKRRQVLMDRRNWTRAEGLRKGLTGQV